MRHLIQDAVASEAEEVEPRRASRRRAWSRRKAGSTRVRKGTDDRRQAKRLAVRFLLNSGASGNRVAGA